MDQSTPRPTPRRRRSSHRGVALLLAAVVSVAAITTAPSAGADGGDNTAVAVNTRDGASVFRLAFSVRRVSDQVLDESNAAVAYSSCTDCQTTALAFQLVLAMGTTDTAEPTNIAIAINQDCQSCATYAAATQLVYGFDDRVRLTPTGQQRLADLRVQLQQLRNADLTIEDLQAAVAAANAELRDIAATEIEPVHDDETGTADDSGDDTTTTTEEDTTATTATTEPDAGTSDTSTTSTSTTSTSSTTTSSSSSTTTSTTTSAPAP